MEQSDEIDPVFYIMSPKSMINEILTRLILKTAPGFVLSKSLYNIPCPPFLYAGKNKDSKQTGTKMAKKRTKVTKKEMARFKALNDLGYSPHAIAKHTGRDPKSVRKYLNSDVYLDPDIQKMVDVIKEKEVTDLYLLGAKARQRLHDLLEGGDTKVIETVAVMDRSFQQRRLLEGESTENIMNIHADLEAIRATMREAERDKPDIPSADDVIDGD